LRPYYNYISLLFNSVLLEMSLLRLCLTVISIGLFAFSTIAVAQAPVANFSADKVSGCSPLTVKFTDLSTNTPTSWIWDFGNGQLQSVQNPTVNFSTPGTYTVKLIARNSSGIDEEEKINYITVFPSPAASFTANITTACVPANIQFTDQSIVPAGGGIITAWSWNFGDGSANSTSQNPSHTYTTAGFYTVSLLITSSTGCQSFTSIGRYIRIINGIDADFVYSQPTTCQGPFNISFQDQSSGPGTLSYLWNFGNGNPPSTLPNPTTSYATPGTYPVQLTVQSNLGCNGTITKNIIVAGKTTDFIAPASICLGQSVTFQNNSSPSPASSFWDFGDGTTSSQTNPTKTYLAGGIFQVRLINNYGNCIDSITKTVSVNTQPPVNFTANDSTSCKAPFTVQFSDLSPSASTWLWDFGDGSPTSNVKNPSHTYNSLGAFSVTLTITLPGGCSNTITKFQYIKISPTTVRISNVPTGGCIPFTFQPIATIQSVDSVISYSWNLGEPGAIYNTQSPTHIYTTVGSYTIQLTITTQNGCIETISIPNGVLTGTPPTVNFSFTPNNTCASTPIQFTDLSSTTSGAIVRWLWDFGDSLTSTLQNPTHTYVDTGFLNVKLIVSNNGCMDSLSLPIQVKPPVAIFGYRTNCSNKLQVTFLDSSLTNSVYGPISYQWKMGDPANTIFTSITPPTFAYPAYGTYTATLTVTNGSCSYTTTKEIKILNEPVAFIASKNPVCKSEVFTLTATGSNPNNIRDYTWVIGTNIIRDTVRSIDLSLTNYGSYNVKLVIEDVNGCLDSLTINNFMVISGPLANFAPNGTGACINKTVNFNDLSIPTGAPITQWTWNFGDGTQQAFTASPFSHTYSQEGSYTVSLIIKDNVNCVDTFAITGAVLITNPKAAFYADTFYCPSAPLQFTDTSSGVGLTYNWYFGDGGTSTLQNPTHNFPAGNNNYNVKLKIRDLVGCEDSITKIGYVKIRKPVASFSMIDSTGICLPLQTSFNFQGSNYESFYWDFGDGATSFADNPSHFYNSYGTYNPKLYVQGPGGCIDSAQSIVNVYDPVANTHVTFAPASGCDSIIVNFTVTAPPGFKYVFYFGDGKLDSTRQTNIMHKYTGPGNYYPYMVIPDKYGCEAFISFAQVSVFGALPLFGIDKKEFCDNGQVTFTNYTLSNDPITSTVWDFGDGNSSSATNPSHNFTSPGSYIVKLSVNTQYQCPSSFVDTVRVYRTPLVSITGKDSVCLNTPETFLGSITQPDSTIKWSWNFGNGNSSQLQDGVTSFSNTGNYNIQLIASNKIGCADTSYHKVYAVPALTAIPASNPITILSGGDAQLNMNYTGAIISYNWLPIQNLNCTRCPGPVANPQFTTKYIVNITDRYGCTAKGEVTVKVVCTGQNFFIPNTFSPNGDGNNDIFYPRGTGLDRAKVLRIFNRWGEIVFEKYDMPINVASVGWDGTWKGKKADAGVFVYQLEIYCKNGELLSYNGNITLIR
jgi:gliding motility-associated-like protein